MAGIKGRTIRWSRKQRYSGPYRSPCGCYPIRIWSHVGPRVFKNPGKTHKVISTRAQHSWILEAYVVRNPENNKNIDQIRRCIGNDGSPVFAGKHQGRTSLPYHHCHGIFQVGGLQEVSSKEQKKYVECRGKGWICTS